MTYVSALGILAGLLTTTSFIPQIIKILRTGHARDISLYMYVILTTGIGLWLIYGILIEEAPIILANSVGFVLCSYIIAMKIYYGKKGDR
mgnify:CR=1 FL=1